MKNSSFKIYYLLIAAVNGVFGMAMPLYYDSLNFTYIQATLLMTIPSIVMLFQPISGIIVDRFERPKEIAIVGVLGSSFMLSLLVFVDNYHMMVIIIFLYALIRMPVWSTVDNIIVTYCINNNLKYGVLRVFASIAWGSSLLIFYPLIYFKGFKAYFIAALLVGIVVAIIISRFPSETKLKEQGNVEEKTFFQGLVLLIKSKNFHYIIIYSMFFSAMFVTNLTYQGAYLQELGASGLVIAVITFLGIFPEFIILPSVEKYLHKRDSIFWLMFVTIMYFARFIVMWKFPSIITLAVVSTFHGIAMSFYIPVFIKHLKVSVPNNVSTTAITITGFTAAVSGITMNVLAGLARTAYGISEIYLISAISMVFAFIVLCMYRKYLIKEKSLMSV